MIAHERWLRRGIAALAIDFISVNAVSAQEAKEAGASPTCALIDFDRSPLAGVLEAKLLGEVEATWLERNAIDEVVKEQELQALFTPEGGAQRAALGKLLKADLLILVRDAPPPPDKSAKSSSEKEKPVPAIDLIVTETRRGLRLLSRSMPRSDDAEADADTLVRFVREALGKHAQQVTEIYAVPPFVSRDLGYEHDYLRGAYARLLEQMLLERPGALVVELAEAQSLAKEVALADPGSRLKREVPFYLLGEYRNEGSGDDRHVRLSLKLMRGEQQLDERSLDDIAASESAATLRTLAGELVGAAAGAKQVAVDPAAEIEALNRREKLFLRLGQWPDAFTAAEASLLLKPGQLDLHHDAIVSLSRLSSANWETYPFNIQRARMALGCQKRGLEHIDAFMDLGGRPEIYDVNGQVGFLWLFFMSTGGNVRVNNRCPRERNDAIVALQTERKAPLLRIIPKAANAGWTRDAELLHPLLSVLSIEEQLDILLRLIEQIKDAPGARERTIAYARSVRLGAEFRTSEERFERLKSFYQRLAALNVDIGWAAQELRRRDEERIKYDAERKTAEMAATIRDAQARQHATDRC